MKINASVKTNLRITEANAEVNRATEKALKNVIVDITNDVIHDSPHLTGNNARSIKYEAEKLSGSVYSTSGYGGYLETGTVKMGPRPYFKPALDRNISKLPDGIKAELR